MAHIADVIKYEGDNSTFIWKHPCEDFNTKSQLIVHESQEAILLIDGQALDTFGPGRHTLDTKNIPLLGKFVKFVMGGETPFHCEVYFINKTVQMAIKWGTSNKVTYIEPTYKVPLEIGANGEINLAVCDSRRLLLKLVGTMNGIAWGDNGSGFTKSLQDCFRPLILSEVRDNLISSITKNNIDILEIDAHLKELSEVLRVAISAGFEEYGLTVPQLYINSILLPENDPNYKEIVRLRTGTLVGKTLEFDTEIAKQKAAADATIKKIQSDANADVARNELENQAKVEESKRKMKIAEATTDFELTKLQIDKEVMVTRARAEQDVTKGQVDAQIKQMSGLVDAEIMAAKGYSQKDVIDADVKKESARALGNMTINGTGGGIASDIVGLQAGLMYASTVAPQMGAMFNGIANNTQSPAAQTATPNILCAHCGATISANTKFCPECGKAVVKPSDNTIECPHCKQIVTKGKFCPECGKKIITACPKCGQTVAPGAKFCLECGENLQ